MVVLGYDIWRARLGGDVDVVGRTVRVAGVPHTVVGVMPPDFRFPRNQQVWLPLRDVETLQPGEGAGVLIFGRLARGSSEVAAQAELETVAQRMALEHPEHYDRLRAQVVPFAMAANGWPRGGLRALPEVRLLQLPALILLLVACLNVGLLILARCATRSAEIAVRTALGAGRMRIVAQVFTEALVLSVLSAGVGVLLFFGLAERLLDAVWSSDWLSLPYWMDLRLGAETVGWALALAAFSAAAASVLPALRVTGRGVAANIQRTGAAGSGLRFGGVTTALVVADLALAVAVVGSVVGIADKVGGAFTRGGPAAFPAEHYLAAGVRLPQGSPFAAEGDTLDDEARSARMAILERTLVERLRAEPRIRGIAMGSALPGMDHSRRTVEVDSWVAAIDRTWVRPGFFEAFDRPVVAGRAFQPQDLEGDRLGVIVNLAFQEEVLAGRSPLGLLLRYPTSGDSSPSYEIVGVAPDLGADPLNPSAGAAVYHVIGPGELGTLHMAIRLGPEPMSFAPRLRTLVGEVDPTAILDEPATLDRVVLEEKGVMAGATAGLALLAGILLALTASSIYAIMSYAVAQRTREIGIRTALGARPGRIAATIGRRAAFQLMAGTLLGMPVAGWLYFLIQEDPGTSRSAVLAAALVPGAGVVLLVGLAACAVPLVRALSVMPTEAIRADGSA